jgi:threonine aldolase
VQRTLKKNENLIDAFKQTSYQVAGHGPRDIQVLKEALVNIDGQQESDMYGKGKIIEDFQEKMATYLGKENAVFFPSGTMAQQHISKKKLEPILIAIYKETGIGLSSHIRETSEEACFYEVSLGDRYAAVPKEEIAYSVSNA